MKKRVLIAACCMVVLLAAAGAIRVKFFGADGEPGATVVQAPGDIPVKGMVTMVDLGADSCAPCKMMAPILKRVEKKYEGKAAVIFIDVWKDQAPAKRFGIRAIPTQIFFDQEGREVFRHEGFMSEADIDRVFARMGVG